MKLKTQKSGFTLVEVIVSMAIIVMVIFAATNLLVSVIRSNSENTHTLIAYGLAQEGLEAVRNMRDSDWLLGAKFEGVIPGRIQAKPWGDSFPTVEDGKHYFTIDYNHFNTNALTVTASNLASMSAPWVLKDITVPSLAGGVPDESVYAQSGDTVLYTSQDSDGDVTYTHTATGGDSTLFHRYVGVERLPYSVSGKAQSSLVNQSNLPVGRMQAQDFVKMRVTSVVSWKEQMRDKEVRLVTELTDWKP
jgi:prepilin-type N-terminal cleavage/methylation domain-containing protein